VLAGRTVVFLSCMDAFTEQLARPIRDQLNDLGYHAVIVMDEPMLRGCFTPEGKVNAYIDASDAFVALCTPDGRVPGHTAENIIDEIGRARTHPRLRDLVCVLKDTSVQLPSNIAPAWDALDSSQPDAAFEIIRRQLAAWGVTPTNPPASQAAALAPPPELLADLFAGVGLGEHEMAEERLRARFNRRPKEDQRRIAKAIFDFLISAPADDGDVHVASSFLEATSRLDPALVAPDWVEMLVESPHVPHRMCAAMILWDLAETMPGVVPLDLVAKLAQPSSEDWYVYAPAIAATKQLSLTRQSALEIISDLGRSSSAEDRVTAIHAFRDLARVDARIVPMDAVKRLAKDAEPGVSAAARDLLSTLREIPKRDRRFRYGKFGL